MCVAQHSVEDGCDNQGTFVVSNGELSGTKINMACGCGDDVLRGSRHY